jgi:hypothetical protein
MNDQPGSPAFRGAPRCGGCAPRRRQRGQRVLYGGDGQSSALQALDYQPTRTSRRRSAVDQHDTWIGPSELIGFSSMLARFGENLSMPAQRPGIVEPAGTAGALASPGSSGISGQTARDGRRAASASRSAILRWLLQETLGGGWTGGGKSRVWFAAEGCVSSAALPSAVRWRQLVCQSGRSGLACSQSTKVASSQ